MMTPAQCRAARALLGLPRPELAKLAAMPVALIADYEAGLSTARSTDINAMKWVLECAGAEFIEDGVKLRKGGV
jgi:predicted transcriptional regulator